MVIPQGVKLGQEPSTTVSFEKTAFAKKSNTGTKIFIGVIIVIAIAVGVRVALRCPQQYRRAFDRPVNPPSASAPLPSPSK